MLQFKCPECSFSFYFHGPASYPINCNCGSAFYAQDNVVTGDAGDAGDAHDCGCHGNESITLRNFRQPGDVLVMTAAIECLKKSYPKRFAIYVDTKFPEVFANNPHIVRGRAKESKILRMAQDGHINGANSRPHHYLQIYLDVLQANLRLGSRLKPVRNTPAIYFSNHEARQAPLFEPGYWIVNAGVKPECSCKQWPLEHYQDVVSATPERRWVQIGKAGHNHSPLDGAVNMIGKTSIRELFLLVQHSAGAIGPSTFLQHICAALGKPYLCLLGGREPVPWVQYPLQHTFHTMGQLDCCRSIPCWKSSVASDCLMPVLDMAVPSPQCMANITPTEVLAILSRHSPTIVSAPASTPAVAVLGMYRGGTSCVAGVLHHLGVSMGLNLKKDVGYNTYEAKPLWRLCTESYSEPDLAEKTSYDDRVMKLRRWMDMRRRQRGTWVGGKHPLMAMMVPEIVEAWGEDTKLIHVIRPIEESVQSMKRNKWWPKKCDGMLATMNVKLRGDLVSRDHYEVQYHLLRADPDDEIRKLADWLGLSPTAADLRRAVASVQ